MMKTDINGPRIKLRIPTLRDTESIARNINDKEIARWTIAIPYPYKREDAIEFIKANRERYRKKKSYGFSIADKTTNEVIGGVGLHKLDIEDAKAELGYWLARRKWGRGIAAEAVYLISKFAFNKLKLHRVYACTFKENFASQRVLEKCGFTLEGVLRDAMRKRGRYHDEMLYGLLKSELVKPY
ncbi:MAG: GNAT family N-acetyltransferase [candidate division Zixibacteria bacterium]|nr:GNAT family N-acetyltransferase [candidate division Zixibacteria bacterium]